MRFDAFFAAQGAPRRKFVALPANDRSASAGLTMRQRRSAFWIDPQCLFKTTARIVPAR